MKETEHPMIKSTRTLRSLSLTRETIKPLHADALARVAGGTGTDIDCVTILGCTTLHTVATLVYHCMGDTQ
jgi:hypothetical protein